MGPYETPLEKSKRHIIEGEGRIAAQVAWIAELVRMNYDTAAEELSLIIMKDRLRCFHEELARQQARAGQ
jgi:hypothetical protein